MTTILLAAYQGFSKRCLLRSGLLERLLRDAPDLRIIVIVRPEDVDQVNAEIGCPNVIVRPLRFADIRREQSRGVGGRLSQIRQCVLNGKLGHGTADHWLDEFLRRYVALGPLHRISQIYFRASVAVLRRSGTARLWLRRLEARLFRRYFHRELYREFDPALLIVPSLGVFDVDAHLIREARAMGVRSLGIVINWDHTTSKGMSAAIPDDAIVWGEKMKLETVGHHDMANSHVHVCGALHYDHYFDSRTFESRESLCRRRGLDPARKIVTYAAMSPRPYRYNPDVVQHLCDICGKIPAAERPQLYVRLHPTHLQLVHENPAQWQAEEAFYAGLMQDNPDVHIEPPVGTSREAHQFDLDREDANVLANVLRHSDVLVCFFSTLNLEAAFLDCPTVNCYVYEWRTFDPGKRTVLQLDHLQSVFASGSSRVVHDVEQLRAAIMAYLGDRSIDSANRKRLAEYECARPSGGAVQCVSHKILELAASATLPPQT